MSIGLLLLHGLIWLLERREIRLLLLEIIINLRNHGNCYNFTKVLVRIYIKTLKLFLLLSSVASIKSIRIRVKIIMVILNQIIGLVLFFFIIDSNINLNWFKFVHKCLRYGDNWEV